MDGIKLVVDFCSDTNKLVLLESSIVSKKLGTY